MKVGSKLLGDIQYSRLSCHQVTSITQCQLTLVYYLLQVQQATFQNRLLTVAGIDYNYHHGHSYYWGYRGHVLIIFSRVHEIYNPCIKPTCQICLTYQDEPNFAEWALVYVSKLSMLQVSMLQVSHGTIYTSSRHVRNQPSG